MRWVGWGPLRNPKCPRQSRPSPLGTWESAANTLTRLVEIKMSTSTMGWVSPSGALTRSMASCACPMRVLGAGLRSDSSWVEPRYFAPKMTPSMSSSGPQGPGTSVTAGHEARVSRLWVPTGGSCCVTRGAVSSQGSGELLELLLSAGSADAPSIHPGSPSGSSGGCRRRGAVCAGSWGTDWAGEEASSLSRPRRSSPPASADKSPPASGFSWVASPWPVAMCRGQGAPSGNGPPRSLGRASSC